MSILSKTIYRFWNFSDFLDIGIFQIPIALNINRKNKPKIHMEQQKEPKLK